MLICALRIYPEMRVGLILIRMDKILSAYNDDKPFSVELVGAVMRQGSFIDKMQALNWTKEGYFDDPQDERVLHHAIARYHAYVFPSRNMTCNMACFLIL